LTGAAVTEREADGVVVDQREGQGGLPVRRAGWLKGFKKCLGQGQRVWSEPGDPRVCSRTARSLPASTITCSLERSRHEACTTGTSQAFVP